MVNRPVASHNRWDGVVIRFASRVASHLVGVIFFLRSPKTEKKRERNTEPTPRTYKVLDFFRQMMDDWLGGMGLV